MHRCHNRLNNKYVICQYLQIQMYENNGKEQKLCCIGVFCCPKRKIIKDKVLLVVCMGFTRVVALAFPFALSVKEWQK